MNFLERERQRMVEERDYLFKDPGLGLFAGKPREFVLSEATGNLWEGIRADAIDYFQRNNIGWWGSGSDPTGHMLSSQLACLNHLYFLRQRPDLATAVLRAIDPDIHNAEVVDDGFVEFEFVGRTQYLRERSFTRGANCTSVDAFMIGRTAVGHRRAFLIEWKYTESYRQENKYIPARASVYDDLIRAPDSPFKPIEPRALYFEPFYQMMRQTLLGWQMTKHEDDYYRCTSYRHVHVIPEQNSELRGNVTSPLLNGTDMCDVWRNQVLKEPTFYSETSPSNFMKPVLDARDAKALTDYLARRYWSAV